jgi:RNA polymerase sigma factor (sigma-70 family)
MAIKAVSNEAELLKRISKNDEKAFEEMFMCYHNQLGEYVLMITKSRELTEEIVLEVFLKVWQNRSDLDKVEKFTSYLFISTRNYTLNALRKMATEERRKQQWTFDQETEQTIELDAFQNADPDYDVLLEQAVAKLPRQQRSVFELKMQGYKNHAISVEMQISSESVKKYQQYALKSVIKSVKSRGIFPLGCLLLSFQSFF